MAGRSPSFLVVGLVLIMFLLGFFYLSCSSKNAELEQTLEEFRQRVQSLDTKSDQYHRQMETINTRKQQLDDEISDAKKQISVKDDQLNSLNSKLNEQVSELQKLNAEKGTYDEQLKDYKNITALIAVRDSTIEKLQQEINDLKQSVNDQSLQLKQQIEAFKKSSNINPPLIPNQRFQPLLSSNQTANSSLLQKPLEKLHNITGELKNNLLNLFAPANDDTQQIARGPADNEKDQPNSDFHQRLQRSLNNTALDTNDRIQFNADNVRQTVNLTSNSLSNETKSDDKNYRKGNPDSLQDVKHVEQVRLNQNVDVDFDDDEPNREQQKIQKMNNL